MGLIFIRTVVIFITLFIVMRLMGKRQIGEMQPYELVITLIISELACIPMADNAIPLLYGVVSIVTVYLLHQIVCLIDLNLRGAKQVLSGSPSIVINKNGIDDTQLKKNNLDVSDLIESLRVKGYFALDAVDYALYESEGMFSALPKQNYDALQTSLPILLIDEGKFVEKNFTQTKRDREYYMQVLKEQNGEAQKALCYELICDVQVFLEGMSTYDEGKEEQKEKNFQDLADWYGELSYTWLRIRYYASKQDYIKVYMWGIYLQHELNQVCEDFGLERLELMDYYEADNLEKIVKQADLIEVKMRQVIEAGGGKIHEYATAEEFLDEV